MAFLVFFCRQSIRNPLLLLLVLLFQRKAPAPNLTDPADNHKTFRIDVSDQAFHFDQFSGGDDTQHQLTFFMKIATFDI